MSWQDGESGGISSSFGKTSVSGNLQTWINSNDGEEIQPVSGRILLYQNGKQIKEQKITSLERNLKAILTTIRRWIGVIWKRTLSQFKVKVEITDNFDRTYTVDRVTNKKTAYAVFLLFLGVNVAART